MMFLRRLWFWKILLCAIGQSFVDILLFYKPTLEIAFVYGTGSKHLLKRIRAYKPKRWLANPWMQMLVTPTLHKPIDFERHELTVPDGSKLTLDMVSPLCLHSGK